MPESTQHEAIAPIRVEPSPCGSCAKVWLDGRRAGRLKRRHGTWVASGRLVQRLGRAVPPEGDLPAMMRALRGCIRFAEQEGQSGRVLALRDAEPLGEVARGRKGWQASPALLSHLAEDPGPQDALEAARRRIAEEDLILRAEAQGRALAEALALLEEAADAEARGSPLARTLLLRAAERAEASEAPLPAEALQGPEGGGCRAALEALRKTDAGRRRARWMAARKACRILGKAADMTDGLEPRDGKGATPRMWPSSDRRRPLRRLVGKAREAARRTGDANLMRCVSELRDRLDGLGRRSHWADLCFLLSCSERSARKLADRRVS